MSEKLKLVWGNRSEKDIETRNARIMELWAMGWSNRKIAETVSLSTQRVSQVIREFGP